MIELEHRSNVGSGVFGQVRCLTFGIAAATATTAVFLVWLGYIIAKLDIRISTMPQRGH